MWSCCYPNSEPPISPSAAHRVRVCPHTLIIQVEILKASKNLQSLTTAPDSLQEILARLPGISASNRGPGATSLLTRLSCTNRWGGAPLYVAQLAAMTQTVRQCSGGRMYMHVYSMNAKHMVSPLTGTRIVHAYWCSFRSYF